MARTNFDSRSRNEKSRTTFSDLYAVTIGSSAIQNSLGSVTFRPCLTAGLALILSFFGKCVPRARVKHCPAPNQNSGKYFANHCQSATWQTVGFIRKTLIYRQSLFLTWKKFIDQSMYCDFLNVINPTDGQPANPAVNPVEWARMIQQTSIKSQCLTHFAHRQSQNFHNERFVKLHKSASRRQVSRIAGPAERAGSVWRSTDRRARDAWDSGLSTPF